MSDTTLTLKVASKVCVKTRSANPVSCLRYREILLLQSTPFMGIAFAVGSGNAGKIPTIARFAVASVLLIAHIWALNDWADVRVDGLNAKKAARGFTKKGVPRRAILRLSLQLLIASLAVFASLPLRTFLIAVILTALGAAYSLSPLHGKGKPVLSSGLHFVGGILHFLLGYSLFSPQWWPAVTVALFFALVFTAGHAMQEVQDWKFDQASGIKTNAVEFGPAAVFNCSLMVFALAYAYLAVLAFLKIVPTGVLVPLLLAVPLHSLWSIETLREGFNFENLQRLRNRYRVLFAVIGLCWVYCSLRS